MTEKLAIFDTTLRDGEQSPGATMLAHEKLAVATALARLGVDVIEAGFPAASCDDLAAVRAIAAAVGRGPGAPIICALARTARADIDRAWAGVRGAARPRIHTFIATSDVHLQHKLRMTRAEVKARVAEMVAYARSWCDDVEFSAEDAARTEPAFLHEVLELAIRAGATTLNIPDTVGYTTPDELGALITGIRDRVPGASDVVLSVHCHDDLGLATANTLAGVAAGARQVEVTINGIGERAGNTSLEEVVMAIATRPGRYGVAAAVDTTRLVETSRLVSAVTGIAVPPNKAVVGANAFAHEAGIHQDGVLKHAATYEIMTPESVGAPHTRLVIGKHSGRAAIAVRLAELGHRLDGDALDRVVARWKTLADRRKLVTDADLEALARKELRTQMPRTLFDKIWDAHAVAQAAGDRELLYIDLHLVHEVTSPQAFSGLRERGLAVRRPDRTVATMDHSIPTVPTVRRDLAVIPPAAAAQLRALADSCREHGIALHDLESEHQGIVHVIGPELGLTQPGMTIVCGDSHTSTHGALGALAFGIGTTEVECVLATQCLLQTRPRTLEVRFDGALRPGTSAKDLVLAMIAELGVGGATGHVIEYTGPAIRALDMEGRMTVCNMSIEAGARAGMIAPDDTTFAWLAGCPHAPEGPAWDAAVARWRELATDDGARFDRSIAIDASAIEPMITFGTNPGMGIAITGVVPDTGDPALARALDYMGLAPGERLLGRPIDVVFIGSCTNGRIADLRAAASVLRGRTVAPGVRVLVVPGSKQVKRQAELEGLHHVFRAAGAEWREPGCSMCIAMNGDAIEPGQYAVSTSNRNFEGRQGRGGRTFLASPLTAAASAVAGRVADARALEAARRSVR